MYNIEADSQLRSMLDPGERLLWSGAPKQGVRLRASDLFLIPFSLFFLGFALVWEFFALGIFNNSGQQSAPPPGFDLFAIIFPLFGVPFILVGLYMLVGRFFVDAHKRSRIAYAVTEKRLIFKTGSRSRTIGLDAAEDMTVTEKPDGSGTIVFGSAQLDERLQSIQRGMRHGNRQSSATGPTYLSSFEMIEGVHEVRRIIEMAREAGGY